MPESLIEIVNSLTPHEQESVRAFIAYLKHPHLGSNSPFINAADDFIAEHSELLQYLAQ